MGLKIQRKSGQKSSQKSIREYFSSWARCSELRKVLGKLPFSEIVLVKSDIEVLAQYQFWKNLRKKKPTRDTSEKNSEKRPASCRDHWVDHRGHSPQEPLAHLTGTYAVQHASFAKTLND